MEGSDTVAIGAGHNGCVATDCLWDGGLGLVLVEADDRCGGMTSNSAPILAAPHHPIAKFSVDSFCYEPHAPCHDLQLLHMHAEGGSIVSFTDSSPQA